MRPLLKPLFTLLCFFLLAACNRTPLQEQQAYVFGTRVEVLVASAQPDAGRQAIAAVLQEFDRLHRAYHAWQPSELSQLNNAIAAGQTHKVSPELADFIREAQSLSAAGDYLFDPGIGELIRTWGFQADEFKAQIPSTAALDAWRQAHPSVANIQINGEQVASSNRHVALDFGGYLKGVALDRAAAILRQQGINNALINIGGNIMALGSKEGRKWRVGIQHPRQPGPMATIELENGEAIGTSGDYQRFFEIEGKRYAHLLDPRTAYPVDHTQAVTVLIPSGEKSGTRSDALSKPIFVAGPESWQAMAKQLQTGMVLRVDRNGQIFVTEALRQRLSFIGEAPAITVVP
jgi:thiamine biosynthesis lipoprotein